MKKIKTWQAKFENASLGHCLCATKREAEEFVQIQKKQFSQEEWDELGYYGISHDGPEMTRKELEELQEWEA